MRTRLIPVLAAALFATALSACGGGSSSSAPVNHDQAVALVAKVETAVQSQSSLTLTDRIQIGTQVQSTTGKISDAASQEYVSFPGGGYNDVREINALVYVRTTSATMLEGLLKLTNAQALKATGQWITVGKDELAYYTLVQAFTIGTGVTTYLPSKSSAGMGDTKTVNGVELQAINGTTTSSAGLTQHTTIWINKATSLPVSGSLTATQGTSTEKANGTFTNWSQPVSVEVPAGSQPLSYFKS